MYFPCPPNVHNTCSDSSVIHQRIPHGTMSDSNEIYNVIIHLWARVIWVFVSFFICTRLTLFTEWMNSVLGHDSALLNLYWAGVNLGEWDEFCYEACPWRRIDRSSCRPAIQLATTVPRMHTIQCVTIHAWARFIWFRVDSSFALH